jgi:hypothetical protein
VKPPNLAKHIDANSALLSNPSNYSGIAETVFDSTKELDAH